MAGKSKNQRKKLANTKLSEKEQYARKGKANEKDRMQLPMYMLHIKAKLAKQMIGEGFDRDSDYADDVAMLGGSKDLLRDADLHKSTAGRTTWKS